jgi:hypothetical protein
MPNEQKYVNGESAKMYARRAKFRTKRDGEFRYPFGLLTVVDLMDRALNVQGVKTKHRAPKNDNRTWTGGKPC